MRIQTKYNLTDKVWLLYHDRIQEVEIENIETTVEMLPNGKDWSEIINYKVRFKSGGTVKVSEDRLFETKQALVNSL